MAKGPKPRPILDRLLPRFTINGHTGCWDWTGYVMPNGYGKLTIPGSRSNLAHRLMYEELVGPIPKGLDIDHLCRNRACVNPEHMEPVTRQINLSRSPIIRQMLAAKTAAAAEREAQRRAKLLANPKHNRYKTHCPSGHPYDEENTRWYRNSRRCKACDRILHNARYRARTQGGG